MVQLVQINIFMKIETLLEFQSTKPVLAYHTTTRQHLKSILKQGLIPNKSSGGYGDGAKSADGYDLSSLPGTYFFKDAHEAERLAKDFNVDKGLPSAIVICQVQPKTATLDEDRLVSMVRESYLIRKFRKMGSSITQDDIRDEANNIIQYVSREGSLDERAVESFSPEVYRYVEKVAQFAQQNTPETQAELKKAQEILTNKLAILGRNKNMGDKHDTFKINEPISFSGANRIVGIYLPDQMVGWGNLGDFERDAYHKYKTPVELVSKDQRA